MLADALHCQLTLVLEDVKQLSIVVDNGLAISKVSQIHYLIRAIEDRSVLCTTEDHILLLIDKESLT